MPILNLLMVCNASKAPDAVEPAFTYDVFDPSPTSIGKVLELVNMHYVVGIATTSLYIDDGLRPLDFSLLTSNWTRKKRIEGST